MILCLMLSTSAWEFMDVCVDIFSAPKFQGSPGNGWKNGIKAIDFYFVHRWKASRIGKTVTNGQTKS